MREALTQEIGDPLTDQVATQRRAEHLLKMIEAIGCQEVLDFWEQRPPRSSPRINGGSTAKKIYSLVSRGQSRTFKEVVLLRIGKYLFTSQILDRVSVLRSQGPPSKQPVAIAGSTGEGKAITRALKAFVKDVHDEPAEALEAYEIRRCRRWWQDGKIWKLLADKVNPAILLLIPSGHEIGDFDRIWDSE